MLTDSKKEEILEESKVENTRLAELMSLLEEAETLKEEGNKCFKEQSEKTDDMIKRARDKYLKSSERLLTRSQDFVREPAVKDLYLEAMKAALMNAGFMSMKMREYEQGLKELSFSKQFFAPKDDFSKLNYRIAYCLNGLERYREAKEVLDPIIRDSKDPLVKVEYQKATSALKEEKKVTQSEKETYAKMFNPATRKEVEQQRKEEKEKEKEKAVAKESEGSAVKYFAAAVAIAGIALMAYKLIKK